MTTHQTINLFHFLGWQGGTIHQVAALIGCEVNDLIYGELTNNNPNWYLYIWGRNWKDLNEQEKKDNIERFGGYLEYWLGVRDSDLLIED